MTTQTTMPLTAVSRHRFTVEQYEEMIRTGILTKEDRVELIEGEVIEMPPSGQGHASGVLRFSDVLSFHFRAETIVQVQSPVQLGADGMPEPDIALLRRRSDYYRSARPGPADIFLLVEVSDSSLYHDRTTKSLLYARAGVPEYWLHDVNRNTLIVFRDPAPDGYRTMLTLERGATVALAAFPDRQIAVSDLIGGAA